MSGFPAQPARDALEALATARDRTVTDLARNLGVDRSTLHRLYRRTTLRYDAADRIAVALGRHPYELWPDWFQGQHSLRSGSGTLKHRVPAPREPRKQAVNVLRRQDAA